MKHLPLAILAALLFIWPIPQTIALRHFLLLLALVLYGLSVRGALEKHVFREVSLPLAAYAALTLWILLNAFFISRETAWVLGEFKGQWLMGACSLSLGLMVGIAARRPAADFSMPLVIIAGALFAHIVYVDVQALGAYLTAHVVPTRISGLTEGPDKLNYLTNMLMAFIFAEGFFRATFRRRLLPVGNVALLAVIALGLFSAYVEGMRNGMAGLFLLMASVASLYWFENRKRLDNRLIVAGLLIFLAIGSALGYFSYRADPRWQTLRETIPIALDTANHKAWLDSQKYPYPKLSNGEAVSPSNYERIAWAKEGIRLVMEHPLGTGYGRTAFGHDLLTKYGEGARGKHSHSGLIDLAIGTGIPGVALWLAFLFGLMTIGARRYFREKNPYALLLFFTVSGFTARMLVDSTLRDHMLEQFLFLAGFFAIAAITPWRGAARAA